MRDMCRDYVVHVPQVPNPEQQSIKKKIKKSRAKTGFHYYYREHKDLV
jgi:hypothetical protein